MNFTKISAPLLHNFQKDSLFNSTTLTIYLTLAELIKDEKIMVGENKVHIEHGCMAVIGNTWFSKEDLITLLPLNPIFQKILNRLNKE